MKSKYLFFSVCLALGSILADTHLLYSMGTEHADKLSELRYKSGHGDAEAQYKLGVLYASGKGLTQDYSQAIKWWHLAADQGNAEAQYSLGVMYGTGNGVRQDDSESDNWLQLSAKQGYAPAQKLLNKLKEKQ